MIWKAVRLEQGGNLRGKRPVGQYSFLRNVILSGVGGSRMRTARGVEDPYTKHFCEKGI
jgi:hypothetical protein